MHAACSERGSTMRRSAHDDAAARSLRPARAHVIDFSSYPEPYQEGTDPYEHTHEQVRCILDLHYPSRDFGWVGMTTASGMKLRHRDIAWRRFPDDFGDIVAWIGDHDPQEIRLTVFPIPTPALQANGDGKLHEPRWSHLRLISWTHGTCVDVESREGGKDLRPQVVGIERLRVPLKSLHNMLDPTLPLDVGGMSVVMADQVTIRSIEWVWRGWVPLGAVTVLDGNPDVGKSTLSVDLAARVTTGRSFPDGASSVGPWPVAMLSAEDDASTTIAPRLKAAGADLSKVGIVQGVRDQEGFLDLPSLPQHIEELSDTIQQLGARLVIIDPLMSYLGDDVKSNQDPSMRRVMNRLKILAADASAAVVLLRHFNKSTSSNAMDRGMGSRAIGAHARMGLVAAPLKSEPGVSVLQTGKNNLAPKGPGLKYRIVSAENDPERGRIDWLGPIDITADELIGSEPDTRREKRDSAKGWLLDQFADGPRSWKELEELGEAEGYARAGLLRARGELKTEGLIEKAKLADGRWVWGAIA